MTDNRTTELLCKLLDERGIEWRSGLEGVTFVSDWCFVEYDSGKLAATCEPVLTPEQAIAATLGSVPDEIELTQTYDAGFRNGVMAVYQQLEGIEDYEELQCFIAEYWGEGEGNDER